MAPSSWVVLFAALLARAGALTVGDAARRIAAVQSTALHSIVRQNNMFPSEEIHVGLPSSGGATVSPFIAEAPKKDSSELGLEEARAAASERPAAAQKGEVAWCSSLAAGSIDAGDFFSLSAWCSPQVYVPHLFWSAAICEGGTSLALTVDCRPRAEAGYETMLPDGTFPEPTDRNMFMQGSTRKELAELYFTEEVNGFVDGLRTSAGAMPASAPTVPTAPVAGPLLLDVVMPLSDAAVDAACAACEGITARWLGWMAAAEKLDQRRTMMTFAHDSKVRATCLAATQRALVCRYGEAGGVLSLCDAGPMDIKDRSSAQNEAATTNFDDSERDATSVDLQKMYADPNYRPPGQGY
jgi:hypothetical protein